MRIGHHAQMIEEAQLAIVFFFGSNLVSWPSTKQKVISRSSAKSEYCALAATVAEVTWIRFALPKFCISLPSPPLVWCDNQSATQLAANLVFHAQSKHIEIDLHFRRNKVLQHALTIQYMLEIKPTSPSCLCMFLPIFSILCLLP